MTREEKLARLEELQQEAQELLRSLKESEEGHSALAKQKSQESWPPKTFYWWYHVMTGLLLGGFGAVTSLLVNVIGSVIIGQHPLEIIRVFLTFPMGQAAFTSDSAVAMLIGVMLYVITGACYGVIFEVVMARYFVKSPRRTRWTAATALGIGIWIVNFYLILSWLQPTLFGGSWILDRIPAWVAMLTHLVFAWTMLVIGEWGHFEATDYRRQAMVQNIMHGRSAVNGNA